MELFKLPLPYEPKIKSRFIVKLPEYMGINEYFIKGGQRPKLDIINGEITPKPITITIADPIGPSSAQKIFDLIRDRTIENEFTYSIELLGPIGDLVEKWELYNCKIVGIDFGELNYSNEGVMVITLTIQPKKVELLF